MTGLHSDFYCLAQTAVSFGDYWLTNGACVCEGWGHQLKAGDDLLEASQCF